MVDTPLLLNFACHLRDRAIFSSHPRGQKLTLSEGWRDAARIANKRWCKKAADELLHTLATALEEILEEYEDGEETLAELLDFYIEDLEERLTDEAERDERDALVKILEDWENGKLPMTFGAGGPSWALNSGRSSYFAPSLLGARGVSHAPPLVGAGGDGHAPPLVDAVGSAMCHLCQVREGSAWHLLWSVR